MECCYTQKINKGHIYRHHWQEFFKTVFIKKCSHTLQLHVKFAIQWILVYSWMWGLWWLAAFQVLCVLWHVLALHLFMAKYHSIVWIDHILFIHSSSGGHVAISTFWPLWIMLLWIFMYRFLWGYVLISHCYISGMEFLGCKITLIFNWGMAREWLLHFILRSTEYGSSDFSMP